MLTTPYNIVLVSVVTFIVVLVSKTHCVIYLGTIVGNCLVGISRRILKVRDNYSHSPPA